jgi:hypothetical protein
MTEGITVTYRANGGGLARRRFLGSAIGAAATLVVGSQVQGSLASAASLAGWQSPTGKSSLESWLEDSTRSELREASSAVLA